MDEASEPARRTGGSIEPFKQATAVSGQAKQVTQDPPGRGYELYDPLADVTHRSRTFDEMVVKADRAQAIRFTALDADGSRTQVRKLDGRWQLPVQRQPLPTPDRNTAVDLGMQAPGKAEPVSVKADAAQERTAEVARIQAALHDRYIVKRPMLKVGEVQVGHTEYRFRGDNSRVAFTESTTRLATDTNSPSVARSMVDVAQARDWKGLRISGNEDFRRMIWLEATVRGVRTVGYEPVPGDLELLRKERDARQVNRVEPLPERLRSGSGAAGQPVSAAKQSARGGGGRKAVLAALEAVLIDRKVPERQREAVMAAATEGLARRTAAGETHRVKVYDHAAQSQRPLTMPPPELQRSPDRAQPAPAR